MNENLNLLKILKDCPIGTMLYSPLFGDAELVELKLEEGVEYPITISTNPTKIRQVRETLSFTSEGKYYDNWEGSECLLFPSREQRDWNKFEIPIPDKSLVWGWNYREVTARKLCFYSAVNRRSFDNQGGRLGYEYDHYELFKGEEPEWAIQARKKLKD